MKKVGRRLVRIIGWSLLVIFAVVVVRTFLFSSQQIPVTPISQRDVADEALNRLQRSITYPTVSRATGVDTAAFEGLDTFLRKAFPRVHDSLSWSYHNTFSRMYHWPGTNPKLPPVLLLAHLDVVPVEKVSMDDWSQGPYSGIRADGYIWGRGTLDDKGNAIAVLESIETLLAEGFQPVRSIYIAFGHDEEVGGQGAQTMAKWLKDEGIQSAFTLDEGSLLLEGALPGLNKPVAMIGLSEKGYVSLELEVNLAEGGHSSMPPPQTAIGILSRSINKLEKNPFPPRIDGPTRALFDYTGPEMDLPLRAIFANLWLTKGLLAGQLGQDAKSAAIIRTTTAPTIIKAGIKDNVLPTLASAVINFRIIPGETPEYVRDRVIRIIDDDRVQVDFQEQFSVSNPAPVSETSAFGFQVIHRTIRELYPEAVVAPGLVVGATDSRHYLDVSAQTYRFMPALLDAEELSGIHGINERISVTNYEQMIRWYIRLLENSCR
jgi:carboxypeptidase PM20D1